MYTNAGEEQRLKENEDIRKELGALKKKKRYKEDGVMSLGSFEEA